MKGDEANDGNAKLQVMRGPFLATLRAYLESLTEVVTVITPRAEKGDCQFLSLYSTYKACIS